MSGVELWGTPWFDLCLRCHDESSGRVSGESQKKAGISTATPRGYLQAVSAPDSFSCNYLPPTTSYHLLLHRSTTSLLAFYERSEPQ